MAMTVKLRNALATKPSRQVQKYIANESVYTRARLQVKSNMGMRVQKPEDKQQVTAELDK